MQHRTPDRAAAPSAGFTLVEMLAVLLILSILMGFLVTSMFGARQTANEKLTEARISTIAAAIGSYEGATGDFPPSRLDDGLAGSGSELNRGVEALVRALWAQPHDGLGLSDDLLANGDGDRASGEQLFELVDLWGNPLAYFHRSDYGEPQVYLSYDNDTGEQVEGPVEARKHPKTERWANRRSFQLISAGADGLFGTPDDLANFDTGE
jgi:prepilin-type N-terminal cleavage/methylation domain-containing protein